jgi:hypothetical protein
MLWLVQVIVALIALLILALTGMLGKTAKRHSRKIARKVWNGVKKNTSARWTARRNLSRGIRPKKKRAPRVLKTHPIVTYEGKPKLDSKGMPADYIACGAETRDGTWCTRNRGERMDGTRYDSCWQHPGSKKSKRRRELSDSGELSKMPK